MKRHFHIPSQIQWQGQPSEAEKVRLERVIFSAIRRAAQGASTASAEIVTGNGAGAREDARERFSLSRYQPERDTYTVPSYQEGGVPTEMPVEEEVPFSEEAIEGSEPAAVEPYEGYRTLAQRISGLERLISDVGLEYGLAVVNQDLPWQDYIDLRDELATYRREQFLIQFYSVNPYLWLDRGEDAQDILAVAYNASQTEKATLALLQEESGETDRIAELVSDILLNMPELFPGYTIGLYRLAVEEFQELADAYRESFDAALASLTQRPVEEIIPDFVWMMKNREALQEEAGHILFFNWLDSETPVFLERREPNSTSFGIENIRLRLNEHSRNWHKWIHPDLEENLSFLYPALEAWYFYQLYGRLAQQMHLFRIAVETGYARLNQPGTVADVVVDLKRAYSSRAPQVFREERKQGFFLIYDNIENVLDTWVQSLSWDERIREGFGLYDVLGEIGTQLKALATPEAIAMMVGFIAFLIAIQFVPYANIVVDAILIGLGGIDLLRGIYIFGSYFDRSPEATTFRDLYHAAQELRGAGEVILNLLFELIGLAATRAIRSYARYRGARRISSLDEIAEHEIITQAAPRVRKAYEEARAPGRAVRRIAAGSERAEAALARLARRRHNNLIDDIIDEFGEHPELGRQFLEKLDDLPDEHIDALAAIQRDAPGGFGPQGSRYDWLDIVNLDGGFRNELLRLVGKVTDVVDGGLADAVAMGLRPGEHNPQAVLGHLHAALTLKGRFPGALMELEVSAIGREVDIRLRGIDVEVKTGFGSRPPTKPGQIRDDLLNHIDDRWENLLYLLNPEQASNVPAVQRAILRELRHQTVVNALQSRGISLQEAESILRNRFAHDMVSTYSYF